MEEKDREEKDRKEKEKQKSFNVFTRRKFLLQKRLVAVKIFFSL